MGNEKRAQACISDAWKQAPHPDLAAFALAQEPDELARARAAKRLVANNPTHLESRILLAQVALDAGLTGEARHQIEAAEAEGRQQRRLFLLLAEVEERERGNTEDGRMAQRNALRRAATAEPDPHWRCTNCHTDQPVWRPKCSACGNVATIQWLTPLSRQAYLLLRPPLLDEGFAWCAVERPGRDDGWILRRSRSDAAGFHADIRQQDRPRAHQ